MNKKLLGAVLLITSLSLFAIEEDGSGGTPSSDKSKPKPVLVCKQISKSKRICTIAVKTEEDGSGGNT